jgi:hypothetical protein
VDAALIVAIPLAVLAAVIVVLGATCDMDPCFN